MFCKNCGSEIQENSKFCQACGSRVEGIENTNIENITTKSSVTVEKKKSSWLGIIGKIVGGIIVLSIIGSCMGGKKDNKTNEVPKKTTTVQSEAKLSPEHIAFLKTVGISEAINVKDNGDNKKFTCKGDEYKLYTNKDNGITKVVKIIGEKEWYVWTDDHGKWNVPENEGKYIVISIDDLNSQLENNAARASKNYKGVYVKFTGYISTIDSDGDYISVKGNRGDFLKDFHCRIRDKKHKEVVMNKNSGNRVTIRGKITDVGEIMGYRVQVDEIK